MCSNWLRTDRRGRGFTGMACKIFDRSKLLPCKNSRRESVFFFLNFFLFFFLCCSVVLTSRIWCFLACFRTCNVLILSQIISACSMISEKHHLQLKSALFLWVFLTVNEHLENPTIVNLSRFGEFQKQTVNSIYLALKIFNFIPANSAKWGEMLDVNIHKTNKVVLALKRKKAKARINAKKRNTTALPCLGETREWKTYVFWTSEFKNCLPKF